jgi:hypothetical protein
MNTLKVGDEVTVIRWDGKPVSIVKVERDRLRLGNFVGWRTSDSREWNRHGMLAGVGGLSRSHIVATTDEHRAVLIDAKIAKALVNTTSEAWLALPSSVLREIARLAGVGAASS